jgi:hypothetical protein
LSGADTRQICAAFEQSCERRIATNVTVENLLTEISGNFCRSLCCHDTVQHPLLTTYNPNLNRLPHDTAYERGSGKGTCEEIEIAGIGKTPQRHSRAAARFDAYFHPQNGLVRRF